MAELWTGLCDFLRAGGPVMIPLGMVSLALWWIALWKIFELERIQREELPLEQYGALQGGAESQCSAWQETILKGWRKGKSENPKRNRRLLDTLRQIEERKAERLSSTVYVLAAIAPLLGLFGTVSGMIETFQAITLFGTGNARAMAGGISAALITTQTGLVVAVPGLLAANMIQRRTRDLRERMERFCLRLARDSFSVETA